MNNIKFILPACMSVMLAVGACNGSGNNKDTTDSTRAVPPNSDNNNATNPSMADTSYPRRDSTMSGTGSGTGGSGTTSGMDSTGSHSGRRDSTSRTR